MNATGPQGPVVVCAVNQRARGESNCAHSPNGPIANGHPQRFDLTPPPRIPGPARPALRRNRRPGRADRTPAHRPARRRAPARRRCAGPGQDQCHPRARRAPGRRLRPRAVHAGSATGRPHGHRGVAPAGRSLRIPARPDLPSAAASRRNQPRAGQGAVRLAGSDGRAPGHRGPPDLSAAGAVPGDGHAEPDRAGRHVPAARSAARSLPDVHPHRLSRQRGGNRDPAPGARAGTQRAAVGRRDDPAHAGAGRVRSARGGARPARCAAGGALPRGTGARLPRCRALRRHARTPHRLGREPARFDRTRTVCTCARMARRPRFRHARRRARDRPGCAAPSRAAELRSHRGRLGRRPPGACVARQGAAALSMDGIAPTLQELVGLRALAFGRRAAKRGRYGLSGHALSPLRGRGMEYAESREYAIGDDARHIDWRLTARSGRPHTKLFQAERERLTLIVADTAQAMYFGTRVRFKSVQAARAGAIAAWAAIGDGDRVAALRGSVREAPVPPAAGPRGALRVLDALVRWYTVAPSDDAGLLVALDHARRVLRPGSRLVLLADPASIAAVPSQRWPALSMHNEVIVLLMSDPLERNPPKAALPFATAEHRVELDLATAAQRQRWRNEFVAPLDAALQALPARGVRVHVLSTDAPSDAWLGAWGRTQASVA